jgi:hypothetical protein
MPYKLIIVFLGICILSSCSNQKNEQEQKADSTDISVTNSLRRQRLNQFNDSLYLLFEKSPEELISVFGKPKKSESRLFTNIHNGEIDTIFHLNFDSVTVTLYYASTQKRYLVGSVEVQNNSLLNILGFHLGAHDTTVVNTIGLSDGSEIDSTGMDIFTYKLGRIAESYTQFYFRDSKLIRVTYLPYLD